MTTSIVLVFLVALTAAVLALSYRRIPEGQVYTLQRRDAEPPRLLTPGSHWIVPLRDRVAHKISLAGRTLQLEATLADNTTCIHGTVYWQVLDPERADAIIDEADALIRRQALEGLRADAASDPATHGRHIKNLLNDSLRAQGMLVTRLDLRRAA